MIISQVARIHKVFLLHPVLPVLQLAVLLSHYFDVFLMKLINSNCIPYINNEKLANKQASYHPLSNTVCDMERIITG